MFSNRYIFTYAGVMVIIVAIVLSSAATLLKPLQEHNRKIEKMSGILASADIKPMEKDKIPSSYKDHIVEEWVVNTQGDIISKYKDGEFVKGDFRAFDVKLEDELHKLDLKQKGKDVKPHFPIYIAEKDGERMYIIPLRGKGLWGPVWGNIALQSDFRTVAGVTFGHKSETPGLGAEIANESFQDRFTEETKTIFTEDYEFTSIEVVKGGVDNSNVDPKHGVDAISGGTITSNGVSSMLENVLSIYKPFVKKHIN